MSAPKPYKNVGPVLASQRCAHGDDLRGYCQQRATQHLWTVGIGETGDGNTMACDEHCAWFDTRKHLVRDHHPITGPCGMPNADWVDSHPTGGPGWCELDGFDWLAAAGHADLPAEAEAVAS